MGAAVRVVAMVLLACGARGASAATVGAGTGDSAAGGHNTTVPYTFAIGPYNQFNPALGGLRDIDFAMQANLFGQIHVMTSTAGSYALGLTATYDVDYPSSTTTLITDSSAFEQDPGDFVPAGGAIVLLSDMATPDYSTSPLDPISKFGVFAPFVGTGTYTLPVNADKIVAVSPTPNGGYTSSAAARAIITVTYTYGPASSTAVTSLVAIYSAGAQNGTLRATVTAGAAPVAGGNVYFVLTDSGMAQVGTTVIGSPNGTGLASAAFTLPAAQPIGTYTLTATYDGGSSYGLSQAAAPFYVRSEEIFANGFGIGGH